MFIFCFKAHNFNMKIFLEFLKLLLELFVIILISKKMLVPAIRKLGESLNLKSHTVGAISGLATSIPEFLTTTFSAITGLVNTGIINILSSNLINLIQYLGSIIINKNIKLIKNRAILISIFLSIITIIIPILVMYYNMEKAIILIPIFIILFYIFNKINTNIHKKYEINTEYKSREGNVLKYVIYIILIGIILYFVGNILSNTLEVLCYTFNISEIIIGIILGIATSIPELITFIESQKFYKNKDNILGLVESSNNLVVSNTLNIFFIWPISIIISLLV